MPRYLTSTSLVVQDLFQGDRSTTSTGSFWWIGCLASIERRHGPTIDLLFANQWVIHSRCISTCMRVFAYAFACLYHNLGAMTIPWNLYHDSHMNPKNLQYHLPKKTWSSSPQNSKQANHSMPIFTAFFLGGVDTTKNNSRQLDELQRITWRFGSVKSISRYPREGQQVEGWAKNSWRVGIVEWLPQVFVRWS